MTIPGQLADTQTGREQSMVNRELNLHRTAGTSATSGRDNCGNCVRRERATFKDLARALDQDPSRRVPAEVSHAGDATSRRLARLRRNTARCRGGGCLAELLLEPGQGGLCVMSQLGMTPRDGPELIARDAIKIAHCRLNPTPALVQVPTEGLRGYHRGPTPATRSASA